MKDRVDRQVTAVFVALLYLVQGCTSMRPLEQLDDREKVVEQINLGDVIIITTKGGEKHQITVRSVTRSTITGDNKEFALADVSQIEVPKAAPIKSILAATGGVLLYIAVVAYLIVRWLEKALF